MTQDNVVPELGDWRSRVIVKNVLGAAELPSWAEHSYRILHEQVTDDAYPCFFGVQAERHGEMFYAFVSRGEEHVLLETMAKFAQLAKEPVYEKNNVAVFFEPDAVPLSHREYHDRFWRTLQMLHDADAHPHAANQVDPNDPAWEFCYQGVEMFVVCACPSFKKRHSRNLGPGMVLLFQPRSVFIDKITNKVIGRRAREQVRKRLEAWDEVGAHPDLGFYGDPGYLEWKQYFLPDDNQPTRGVCPFSRRQRQASPSAGEIASTGDGTFPLTPAQEGLWFSWCMDPDSAACHVSHVIELNGPLEVGVLRRALDAVVERHAILRTAFMDIGGVPRQCVDDDAARSIDWAEHDLQACAQPMTAAHRLLQERGTQSFDLGSDGLLRVTLLCLAANRHILQLCAHQIMLDAWSFDPLRRELLGCYQELRSGREPNLPELSMQFGDHAVRERKRLDTLKLQDQQSYWRERLGDTSHVLDLPLDHPRPAYRSTTAGRLSHVIDAELDAGIRRLASAHGTTPFVVTLSAFAVLLQRYSAQSDVRMAVPLRRQDRSLGEAFIGQLMNIAVIRLNVSSIDAFSTLIEQSKRYLAEARAHGDLPFSRLIDSLRVHRSLASTPLCQVMFNQWPAFEPEVYGELEVRPFDDAVGRASYDLVMNIAIGRDRCVLFLDYATALFDASTIQRLLAHYIDLLEQLTQSAVASEVMASLQLRPAA